MTMYGLFRTSTEYDTWETLIAVSENAPKLKTIATKKNNANKRDFVRRIEYAKDKLGIKNYPKSVETLCEENKWFVQKVEVI